MAKHGSGAVVHVSDTPFTAPRRQLEEQHSQVHHPEEESKCLSLEPCRELNVMYSHVQNKVISIKYNVHVYGAILGPYILSI